MEKNAGRKLVKDSIQLLIRNSGRYSMNLQEISSRLGGKPHQAGLTGNNFDMMRVIVQEMQEEGTIKTGHYGVRLTEWRERVYIASSWRNVAQQSLVKNIRKIGYDVYDFKHPGKKAFHSWDMAEKAGKDPYSIDGYMKLLEDERIKNSFISDAKALDWADICILLLPCNRSAHLEAGYMCGKGKLVYILLAEEDFQPELMYMMVDGILKDRDELTDILTKRIVQVNNNLNNIVE